MPTNSNTTLGGRSSSGPAQGAAAVTPNDGANLAVAGSRGLWVGGAGNVAVVTAQGDSVTFTGVPAGYLLQVAVSRVLATGTTATNLLALY